MFRKLVVIWLVGVICLLGVVQVLAGMPSPPQYNTPQEYEEATGKIMGMFGEAPMLKARVATGEVPSVGERLPKQPLVVVPVERVGDYGGTWNKAAEKAGTSATDKFIFERLIKFNEMGTELLPNVARSWEITEDGKVFTFHLREGMKWSDGAPFTADDIVFNYEDILLNKEITPSFPDWLTVGGKPVKIEKIDEYTVEFRFSGPYGVFLSQVASPYQMLLYAPKHYLKQFHPGYASADELEKMVEDAGVTHWYVLFGAKTYNNWGFNSDYPTLQAWQLVVSAPAQYLVYERNAYYWKVDPEGNQLPYLDRLMIEAVQDGEMINLRAIQGQIDFQTDSLLINNYTLFEESSRKGDYRMLKWDPTRVAWPVINLNQTCQDPILRELFEDVRFRVALSLGIDREELNEIFMMGLGYGRQASFVKGTRFYSEEWENAYIEHDPEKANVLLDEIGLKWDEDHEYRLRGDGKQLSFTVETVHDSYVDIMTLIASHWKKLGIKIDIKYETYKLFVARQFANENQGSAWGTGMMPTPLARPYEYFPIEQGGWQYGAWGLYGLWYQTGGKSGEEPKGDLRRMQILWDEIKVTIDEKETDRLMAEAVALHAKNIWLIGTAAPKIRLVVVKNNFRNVPETFKVLSVIRQVNPEQFFIEQ